MSVPRPAMLVAMVTAPTRPAWATISDSRAANSGLALSSSCLMPRRLSIALSFSDLSTSVVPISIGRPRRSISATSSILIVCF